MPEPKISVNVRLSPQIHKGVKRLADKPGASFQAIVERALKELLEREKTA